MSSPPSRTASSSPQRWIALLGHQDHPTDALEDYCQCLAQALQKRGRSLEVFRVPWAELGWRRALRDIEEQFKKPPADEGKGDGTGEGMRETRSWALIQYTALSWSRRGFPWRFTSLMDRLSRAGVRILIVFHDPQPFTGSRVIDRLRGRVQIDVMRSAAGKAEKIVSTISPDRVSWMQDSAIRAKTVTLPAGSNVAAPVSRDAPMPDHRKPVIVVFGCTEHSPETDLLASVVRRAAEEAGPLHLTLFGRGAKAAGAALRPLLDGTTVELQDFGILEPQQAGDILAHADLQLFVRSGLSSRRSSAVAGIVCGLPIVGFADGETAFPITEAGVRLVPRGDREALVRELVQVLQQPSLREDLRQRSLQAADRYFSWDRIADAYLSLLETNA